MKNIVFITDKGFYLPTVVAIKSFVETHKNKEDSYNVYCLYKGLEQTHKDTFLQMSTERIKVKLIDADEIHGIQDVKRLKTHECSASPTALLKFELANIFEDLDQLLYMDGDIIVKDDISSLFDIDLKDNYVAAAYDTGIMYNKTVRAKGIEDYFNSGVMLLNLKKMREDNIREVLYNRKFASSDVSLMDQNVFNEVFSGKARIIPLKFNCQYISLVRAKYFHNLQLEVINATYKENYRNWEDIEQEAIVVHYASFDKPWKYADVTGVELWDKYYKMTPIGTNRLDRKKLYLKTLYTLSQYKIMKLPVNFIWECQTIGARKALLDVKKFIDIKLGRRTI